MDSDWFSPELLTPITLSVICKVTLSETTVQSHQVINRQKIVVVTGISWALLLQRSLGNVSERVSLVTERLNKQE